MFGHMVGWVVANLAVPYLLPIAFIKFLQATGIQFNDDARQRVRITYLLREAQYAMGSVAIACTAIFEIFVEDHLLKTPFGIPLLIALFVLTLLNSLVFVLGVIFGAPSVEENVDSKTTVGDWMSTYRLGAGSLILALAVSICSFATHYLAYSASKEAGLTEKQEHNRASEAKE